MEIELAIFRFILADLFVNPLQHIQSELLRLLSMSISLVGIRQIQNSVDTLCQSYHSEHPHETVLMDQPFVCQESIFNEMGVLQNKGIPSVHLLTLGSHRSGQKILQEIFRALCQISQTL